jgi:predicted aspartyl protease
MSLIRSFNFLAVLISCAICLPAGAAVADQTEPTDKIVTAKIKLDDLSMIIVPVSINGSGPYDFMLDTGCTKTMVDERLAKELHLSLVGEKTIVGVLASTKMSVVHVNSISVGGAVVSDGDVYRSDHLTTTDKVRGVLGEDFLRNFDVLIDYGHEVIRLENPDGPMAETAVGEHLPLELNGTYHGQPTRNRLVVSGHIRELGDRPMSLLLDSGANRVTLFRDTLGPGANQQELVSTSTFNKWISSSAETRMIRSLCLGDNSVSDVRVVALSRRADVDTDGVVPTSLFHSIFISHRGRFVILNPSLPKGGRYQMAYIEPSPTRRES